MAIRYKALTELYQETQRKVTAPAEWQQFLTSACRNYRLSFDEQLLVYAQRPDATAVLEIERWNKRFGRWVNRGANGIAVFDGEHSGKQRLKYYFDVSDTHEGRFSRPVPLWTVRPEYAPDIIEALENSFGELEQKDNLGAALLSAANNAVEDNIHDYLSELYHLTEGSFLEELDEYNVEVMYRRALQTSIGYMLVVRCGLDPSEYFEDDDFRDVLNFNTPETLNALGVATGDISQMCLSEIARTTLALQRQPQKENRTFETAQQNRYPVTEQETKQPERSNEYGRDHIQQAGRLQPAESSAPAGAGSGSWEIRITAPEVPEGEPQDHLHQSVDQRETEQSSGGDRADGTLPDGSGSGADGQDRGRDGGTEGPRSDEVGAAHEQPSERGGGNDPHGADLQLTDTEQADSQELPAFLDEKQIMAVIANKDDDLKYKKQQIELFFSVHSDQQERADYLKSAYQDRYTEIIADGQRLGYKPQEDGLLMWEGSYLSRTKESVFSWDLVARWTAQLIDKKEYFIQTDIRQLPTQESQQMTLFDFSSFGSSTPSEGEQQRFLFPRQELSQQVIDEAMCIGANDQNSRLIICAYFKKDKPLEDNAQFLMEHYGENGAGFYLDSRKYSIWYNAEGIHVAEGETAQRTAATLIPWEQAAKRIRELLDLGRYMPQSELDRVDGYERQQRAAQLWYLRQDFAEGTADAGFLPTINAIYNTHQGFPEESAAISDLLGHPEGLQNLRDELEQFVQAYAENRELLRFHFHRPQKLLEQLADLQREPLHFTAAEGYDPQRRFFISGDEIDNLLRGGKGGTDYRLAVYSFYRNHSDRKQREDFLKHYHGEYSGHSGGNDDVTYQLSKGVHFSHGSLSEPYAKVELKWNAVEKRVSAMIAQGRFLSDDDRAAMPQYEKHQLAQNIRTFFENVPQEQPHPYPYGFDYWEGVKLIEPQLDDPARVEEIYQMMLPVWEATPQDDRMYDLRQRAFENLTAYRQGTFTLFAEKKEPVPPQAVQEPQKAYDLGFGHLGNGLTVWNRMEEVDGDYRTVAHIAPDRTVQIYDEEMPQEIRDRIQQVADTSEMTVSTTQNAPVFSVPPREEPPQKEETADLYPVLAAQVLRLIGEFDGSRMGYGDDDAQAAANIAQQLHNTVQRQEIRALLQSFLDHTDPEEEIAADVALCMERINELPQPLTQDQALLEQAKELIDQFCQEEYDSYADFSDLGNVGIAYTTVTDQEIPIQVNVDLVNYRVERYLDGQFLERRQYDSLGAMIQNELIDLTFDDLISVSEEELESIGVSQDDYRLLSRLKADCDYYYRENSLMHPMEVSVTAENRIRGMIELRECVRRLIEYQTEGYPDEDIQAEQKKLNSLYDSFTAKYGLISSRGNKLAFSEDSSYCLLCSLEVLDEQGNLKRKADMFSKRTIRPHVAVTSVDTASEALAVSISEKACVDMGYMAELSGKSPEELESELAGVIFRNIEGPENPDELRGNFLSLQAFSLVTADEYLSGNVRRKLRMAKAFLETAPDSQKEAARRQIEALEAVQPADLGAGEIGVRIGANWVPIDIYQQFMEELLTPGYYARNRIKILRSEVTGQWAITDKNSDRGNVKVLTTYGTKRMTAYHILEQTLNQKDVRVFDYIEDENGNKKAVLNKKETAIAQDRQELIKQKFSEWIWRDIDRRELLCRVYNETFNGVRPREYDGRHIRFEGMNPEISLRPHQINAIAHVLYGGNTLLAHEVGAGKTYEMVAAAMEMKRLGLCTKSLIVVPNHITEQWAAEFLQLYPSANILVATKKDFEKQNRKKFCSRISTGDYDAIIIGHSQFEKIPMSAERQQAILQQQIDDILFGIEQAKSQKAERYTIKQMERTRKSLEAKLAKLNDQSRKDDVVTFEELGVDRIFIDESHYFKNLFLMTKMRNVGGIAQTEAQKSSDLFMKCQYLDELTGGRGVIFATGTPISNSMVELYTIQRYLQYRTLQEMGLIHFDDWASNFGETITAIELSPEGSGYRAKTRFAKFYNLPELMSVFKQVADIQTADMLHLPVPKANFHTEVIKPSEIQQEMIKGLAERAEKIRGGGVDPHVDNMLRITNDGRKLALDMRLIQPLAPDDPDGKVAVCARNVYRIWEQTKEKRSTQLVFCDLSTPTTDGSFSVYDDLKKKLLDAGIPEDEIAFIHTADSEAKKKELFAKVRAGQVRILMGSTQKMGAGTNVQDRLIALHDLDCPWRPSDLQQRLGRIVRQGNENEEVEIYRYVTEGTFDAYLYQLVENKQKFIAQIMTSKAPVRVADDVDETALSYSEIKALATGNPLIIEKCNLDMEVARLNMLKASHLNQVYALEELVYRKYPEEITRLTERIAGYEQDVALAAAHPKAQEGFCGMEVDGRHYTEKEGAGKAIIDVCTRMTGSDAVLLGQYRGFSMVLAYDGRSNEYRITLKGTLSHTVTLGADVFGNITRLDNALENLAGNLDAERAKLEEARVQLENARTELATPFAREDELAEKTARLKELNILLNMDEKDKTLIDEAPDEGEEPPMRKVVGLER